MPTWNLKEHRWEQHHFRPQRSPSIGDMSDAKRFQIADFLRGERGDLDFDLEPGTARSIARAAGIEEGSRRVGTRRFTRPRATTRLSRLEEERTRRATEVVDALGGSEAVMDSIKSKAPAKQPRSTLRYDFNTGHWHDIRTGDRVGETSGRLPKEFDASEDERIEVLKYFIQHGHEQSLRDIERRFSLLQGTVGIILREAGLSSPWAVAKMHLGTLQALEMKKDDRHERLGQIRQEMLEPYRMFHFINADVEMKDMTITDFADYYAISENLVETLMNPNLPLPYRNPERRRWER